MTAHDHGSDKTVKPAEKCDEATTELSEHASFGMHFSSVQKRSVGRLNFVIPFVLAEVNFFPALDETYVTVSVH